MSPQIDEIRKQLGRILENEPLRGSPQLARFLTFVVETTLAGKGDNIKGYAIAVEVLGRGSDFDAQADSIVRVAAGRLRSALDRYYSEAGSNDPLVIDLPRGSYVPTFRRRTFIPSSEPTSRSIETLRSEKRRIRDAVISLIAALLQNIALDPSSDHREVNNADAEHFLHEAEELLRCAQGLAEAGHALMAKAVEIETMAQREKWKK